MRKFFARRLVDWEENVDWSDVFSPTYTHKDFYEEIIPRILQRRIGFDYAIDKIGSRLTYVMVDYVLGKRIAIPFLLPKTYRGKEAKKFAKKYHLG